MVLYHFQAQIDAAIPAASAVGPLVDSGYLGVDLFFCLSGFILSYNYLHRLERWSPRTHANFLWLRLARVWPVHFFTLNVALVMFVGGAAVGFSVDSDLRTGAWAYVENVVMVHAWFGEPVSFNGPSWSVSAEWFAYLLFPLLAPLVLRARTLAARVGAVVASYAVLGTVWLMWFWEGAGATSGALFRVGLEFMAGCFLFLVWERTTIGQRAATVAIVGSVAGVAAGAWWLDRGHSFHGIVLAPLFGALILGLAASRGWVSRFLGTPAMVFGGEASYSLYMTHGLVQPVALEVLPVSWLEGQGVVLRVGALVALAALVAGPTLFTYWVVERPARVFMRRRTPCY